MLQVDGLSTGYGRTQVLWDLSLKVDEGEFVALVGANGAGKTHSAQDHLRRAEALVAAAPSPSTASGSTRCTPTTSSTWGSRTSRRAASCSPTCPSARTSRWARIPRRSWKERQRDHGRGLRALPAARGAAEPAGADAERRRAADAGHGPRTHVPAADGPRRRAVERSGAEGRHRGLRDPQVAARRRASPSCWSSRTCARLCRSPTGRTCSRTGTWPSRASARCCARATT